MIRGRDRAILAAIWMCGVAAHMSPASLDIPAELKVALKAIELKQTSAAIAILQPLSAKYPKIADYPAWFLASAQFDAERYADVPKTLEKVWAQTPTSPLIWRSALLAARAYQKSGDPRASVEILRKHYAKLPQPQGDLALADAFSAGNDRVNAAVYYQRVYYSFPTSAEAAQAETALARLQMELGDNYPPALGSAMLGRALKLLDTGQAERARKELVALLPQIGGADRDIVRVKIGVADYQRQQTTAAQKYLEEVKVDDANADAERIYYLLQCARRLKDRPAMDDALAQLSTRYPASSRRLDAILATANSYLLENDFEHYEPLYQACYQDFPKDAKAPECHWKVAWSRYVRRRDDATDLLREQLKRFPASDEAPAALYFLGRTAENANDSSSAREYYSEIVREYPNHYYMALARERLESAPLRSVIGSSRAAAFLQDISFPTRVRVRNFEPAPLTTQRLERARMLASAGLDDWAEIELRYAAQYEDQPHAIALELAEMASRRSAPDQAIRLLKRYAPDYLYLPVESAPDEFWKLAFPLPYRADLERFSKQQNIDLFLLASLVRQESEFDAKATNPRSSARGLAQILPSTGRELSRRLGLKPYTTAHLYQPAVNMQLSAYYLRSIADRLDGRWEAALAAYNAGPSRAAQWLKWADFREPAEFVETIPFRETRNYVAVIFRNVDAYRRIYGRDAGVSVAAPSTRLSYANGDDQPKKNSRPAGAR